MIQSKILIVDDHPIVVQGLRQLLQQDKKVTVCGEAGDSKGALQEIRARKPDLMIVDISLPGIDGLELIKSVHAEFPDLIILVLSMHDERTYAGRALRAGAMGYVMKDQAALNLLAAIRTVLNGDVYVSPQVSARIVQDYAGRGSNRNLTPIDRLTDRELEVFRMIGKGVSTRQIAESLHLSVKTVDTYRSKIKEKLQLANSSEMIQQAVYWMQTQGQI